MSDVTDAIDEITEPEPGPVETPDETMARLAAEDHRPAVTVTKAVNLSQLADELGAALCASGGADDLADDDTETLVKVADHDSPVSQKKLAAAVEAHVADPLWGLTAQQRREAELRDKAKAKKLTDAERTEALDLLIARSL